MPTLQRGEKGESMTSSYKMPAQAVIFNYLIYLAPVVFFIFEVLLTYKIMPISDVQQSDSVLHIYTFFKKIYYSPI